MSFLFSASFFLLQSIAIPVPCHNENYTQHDLFMHCLRLNLKYRPGLPFNTFLTFIFIPYIIFLDGHGLSVLVCL